MTGSINRQNIALDNPLMKKGLFRHFRILFFLLKLLLIIMAGYSILAVALFSVVRPPATPLMIIRVTEQQSDDQTAGIVKEWAPIENISPYLINAVIAAEDNRFMTHWGIDRQAIHKAMEENKTGTRMRGASTITQQVAKNLFLWPSRTYIRKGFELYFTFLIELFWSKKRIMEMYLNIVEMGNGIYGAEAAAQKYFHKSASQLTQQESALIAISLPNPRQRNPAFPSEYMISRQNTIIDLMRKIEKVKFD